MWLSCQSGLALGVGFGLRDSSALDGRRGAAEQTAYGHDADCYQVYALEHNDVSST